MTARSPWTTIALRVALFASLFVAACGGNSDASHATAVNQRVNAWTIPGVLRIESVGKPDNLNPIIGQDSIDTDLSMF